MADQGLDESEDQSELMTVVTTEYFFCEGLPETYIEGFVDDIFRHPDHLRLQAVGDWNSFSMIDERNVVVAAAHFHIESGIAKSPYRAPYGPIYFSKKLTAARLKEFIQYIEAQLKSRGAKRILLKNPPAAYDPESIDFLNGVLKQEGYELEREEISAIIFVGQHPFNSILHHSERKRLRKCIEGGFTFHLLPLAELEEVYIFLKIHRQKKGYALSMSLEELTRTAETFPDRFFLSIVKDDQKWAAANVSIRVNRAVLYNFYHDHDDAYDPFSPVVLLNQGLYQFSQKNGIKLLDLGTSHKEGKVSESLLDFKLRLGAKPSRKLIFGKNIT